MLSSPSTVHLNPHNMPPSVPTSIKQRRVMLALPPSEFSRHGPFRDGTGLDLISIFDDGSKPLRFDGNAGAIAIRYGNSPGAPHSEGEKEQIHLPEKRPWKKGGHEETLNLVRRGATRYVISLSSNPRSPGEVVFSRFSLRACPWHVVVRLRFPCAVRNLKVILTLT